MTEELKQPDKKGLQKQGKSSKYMDLKNKFESMKRL